MDDPTQHITTEPVAKINTIYQNSLQQINDLGGKALSLIKNIKRKREEKKIESIREELKK